MDTLLRDMSASPYDLPIPVVLTFLMQNRVRSSVMIHVLVRACSKWHIFSKPFHAALETMDCYSALYINATSYLSGYKQRNYRRLPCSKSCIHQAHTLRGGHSKSAHIVPAVMTISGWRILSFKWQYTGKV